MSTAECKSLPHNLSIPPLTEKLVMSLNIQFLLSCKGCVCYIVQKWKFKMKTLCFWTVIVRAQSALSWRHFLILKIRTQPGVTAVVYAYTLVKKKKCISVDLFRRLTSFSYHEPPANSWSTNSGHGEPASLAMLEGNKYHLPTPFKFTNEHVIPCV